MRLFLSSFLAGGILFVSGTSVAFAAPNADLQIQLQGPSSVSISTPTTYTVTVKNLGPATTNNIQTSVTFPLTDTSPTVHILGNVAGIDQRCSIVSRKLVCSLGTLKKSKSVSFTFTYNAPVSTKSLQMTAAITGSSVTDPNSGNNQMSFVPSLAYPTRAITAATVENSHCTGTNLTSYFECALYPSSIASHVTTLNGDTSITFSEPGYTGNWSQNAAKTTLFFEYFDGAGKIAEFNGFAINGSNCFDGLTTFFPATTYVSPYRVCIQ